MLKELIFYLSAPQDCGTIDLLLALAILIFIITFKVSELAEGLRKKSVVAAAEQPQQPKPLEPDSVRAKDAVVATTGVATISGSRGGSETCHFCEKRVYVVERMSAEGRFFHRSCFRCDYCGILLRLLILLLFILINY